MSEMHFLYSPALETVVVEVDHDVVGHYTHFYFDQNVYQHLSIAALAKHLEEIKAWLS